MGQIPSSPGIGSLPTVVFAMKNVIWWVNAFIIRGKKWKGGMARRREMKADHTQALDKTKSSTDTDSSDTFLSVFVDTNKPVKNKSSSKVCVMKMSQIHH